MTTMMSDDSVAQAITSLVQRAEREEDPQRLIRTYVDTGIISQLNNANNQVLFGRRGTGKTHLFKVLEHTFSAQDKAAAIYIDMRMLGSSTLSTDTTRPPATRALGIYQDIMAEIHNYLLESIVKGTIATPDKGFEQLTRLNDAVFAAKHQAGPLTVEEAETATDSGKGQVALSTGGPKLSLSSETQSAVTSRHTQTFEPLDKVYFPDIHKSLKGVLDAIQLSRLVILLDEWSSCPIEIQPLVAEFIKRTFLAEPRAILKIAALEYRSNFFIHQSRSSGIGLELSGDISTAIDLDSYFVYDQNPQTIIGAYEELLYRHVSERLPESYLRTKFGIVSVHDFRQALFTQASFQDLARAAEGVARDLINIFGQAYLIARRRGLKHIQVKEVEEAAGIWFQQDKDRNLTTELRQTLKAIITTVIGHRKARSFMVAQELSSHQRLGSLIDLRVVHLIHRGYADKENPGLRYNIYTLDYGTYVGLKRTGAAPELDLVEVEDVSDRIVPFDDKRSIRRIILTSETLDATIGEVNPEQLHLRACSGD